MNNFDAIIDVGSKNLKLGILIRRIKVFIPLNKKLMTL